MCSGRTDYTGAKGGVFAMLLQEILRVLVASALGALIGIERERLDRGAGLRTHALVATASALLMIISAQGFNSVVTADHTIVLDPSRIASQVVSGIGFLGAGLIILRRNTVFGLTTAASIWAVAGIGLAAGAGLLALAAITTGLLLVILVILKILEQRFFPHKRLTPFTLTLTRQPGQLAAIEAAITQAQLDLWLWELKPGMAQDEYLVQLDVRGGNGAHLIALAETLQGIPGVKRLTYRLGRSRQGMLEGEAAEMEERTTQ
jgi:putative Mg2+ transporter-C (MgtC) family protein